MTAKKTTRTKQKLSTQAPEKDGVYFLKLVLFFVVGCLWVRLISLGDIPLPVGLFFGLFLANHEHFQIDKKIEYAVLLVATVLSFIAPIGFVLSIG